MTQGIIDRDIPCRMCSYNLRGLTAGGLCPECGLSAAESLKNWLADVDPFKSHLLTRGAKWAIAITLLRIPLMIMWTATLHPNGLAIVGIYYKFRSPWFYTCQAMMNPIFPIGFVAIDCIAFVLLSSLRHPHIRKFLPTLAAVAVVLDVVFFSNLVHDDFIASLIVIDLIFFAAIAFFWCRDGMRIAQKAGEPALARGFLFCSAALPISTLPFLCAIEITILFNNTGTPYSIVLLTAGLQIMTDVVITPSLLAFCWLMRAINIRLGKTIRVAQFLRGSSIESASIAANTPIDRDIPCRDCGYNLRTLAANSRCPECGRLVADSIHNWLDKVDPHKSRLIRSAASIIVAISIGRIVLASYWIFIMVFPQFLYTSQRYILVGHREIPLAFLAADCIAFLALSPLRHWPVRMIVPILALGSSILVVYVAAWSFDPILQTVSLYLLEAIFFAGIAFFWCGDAARIARLADERRLLAVFLVCAILIPLSALIFVAVNQSRGGMNYYWNARYWMLSSVVHTGEFLWFVISQILLIPALIAMCVALLSLRARIQRTLLLAGG